MLFREGGADMKRFFKVLRKDCADSIRPVSSSAAIVLGIYLLLWILFTFVFGSGCSVEERKDYFWILVAVFCALAPGTAYSHVKDESGRTGYLLLPASKTEKYSVMVILSVFLYPAGYLLVQWGTDSFLTLVGTPGCGYWGSLRPELSGAGDKYLLMVLLSSIFLVGNVLFKNRSVGKTLILTLLCFLSWSYFKRHVPEPFPAEAVGKALLWVLPPVLWTAGYGIVFRISLQRRSD